MNILLIGSGGREHALAWKILQSPHLSRLYVTSPNASSLALQQNAANKSVTQIAIPESDNGALVEFAQQNNIALVIIGSEAPLAAGLSDALMKVNINVFGPSQQAAAIESSKVFAKNFMLRHHIPTAHYATFTEFSAAKKYVHAIGCPIVIKASGLAAGKGVFLPDSLADAENVLQKLLEEKTLGVAGNEIVIEERLQGEEVSLLAFTDGITVKTMPPTRDYKRLQDNDQGANTGGMGTYAPSPLCPPGLVDELIKTVLQPTVDGLRAEGKPFVGVLYAGLMLTAQGVRVLEFNCRFGDPETQVLMPLLESDLLEIMQACVTQQLQQCAIRWKSQSAVCVVLAAAGYPDKPQTGDVITGLDNVVPNSAIFHAATRPNGEKNFTTGGRVLGVTAWADTLSAARELVYQHVKQIHFNGMQYRHDIAQLKIDHYAQAGVDINAGNRAVDLMKKAVQATYDEHVLAGIGAFGGMYSAASFKKMQAPVLVASTDGIGTKVELAARVNRLDNLGFDIVNHSVNDILVQNARPLFFLDYIASSKLDAEKTARLVNGMAVACRAVNCALLGGETAEMPGVYQENTFDIAGTIVGVVERDQALPRKNLQAGDVLLGLVSSGPHTNGYSLIRKLFATDDLEKQIPELESSLADALLVPHRCYLPVLQAALDHPQQPIKALIHITGGGFFENIPRILPENLDAIINTRSWTVPALFQLIQKRGAIPSEQMYRVFNMGIGMVIVVAAEQVALLQTLIHETLFTIGELTSGKKQVMLQ